MAFIDINLLSDPLYVKLKAGQKFRKFLQSKIITRYNPSKTGYMCVFKYNFRYPSLWRISGISRNKTRNRTKNLSQKFIYKFKNICVDLNNVSHVKGLRLLFRCICT